MARAVIATTGRPDYQLTLRRVFDNVPVHLVAGERSREAWNVPDWALRAARSLTVVSDTGHLLMVEQPRTFAETIVHVLTDRVAP